MPVYTNTVPQTVRQGDTHPAVSFLRDRLKREGFTDVKAAQTAYKLVVDGICGPKTWELLLNGGAAIVPYRQNDTRWGAIVYTSSGNNSQAIANSGCGPTSLAVAMSAYGKRVEPPELCKAAVTGGYRTANDGTSWGFFAPIAAKYGCKTMQVSRADSAIAALIDGNGVIASMGPGDYTKNGHYIELRDYDPFNQRFYTIDPASAQRNSCSRDVIEKQGKQFWIVTPAASPETLRLGSTGETVKKLQTALNQNGARLSVDGQFGAGTEAAVKDFQRKKGLAADGVAGPVTMKALGM